MTGKMTMTRPTRTIDHVDVGVLARYTEANGLKLAVCVGLGRDHRPRVRLYRAKANQWTQPELVDRAHLVPLSEEIVNTSRRHVVLTRALEALWSTPSLGFRPADLAFLATE